MSKTQLVLRYVLYSKIIFVLMFVVAIIAMVLEGGIIFGALPLVYFIGLFVIGLCQHRDRMLLNRRLESLREQDNSYREQVAVKLKGDPVELEQQVISLMQDREILSQEILDMREDVVNLHEISELQSYGLYETDDPSQDSVHLGFQIKEVQREYKALVKEKVAVTGTKNWTVSGSATKGRKIVRDTQNLMLRAFNNEVENVIRMLRPGRLEAAEKRVIKAADSIARNGTLMEVAITPEYVLLRIQEIRLTHEYRVMVQIEKELRKEHNEMLREEAKARRELEAAKAKQVKEIAHRQKLYDQMVANGDMVAAETAMVELQEAKAAYDNVESTLANTRAGYVYVASNKGSLGHDVIKIGMTRRVNPEDRIKELSNASVPFNFVQHTMIWSEDAVGLERELHRHFNDRRVNKINMRREYFYATPAEVREALEQYDVMVLDYQDEVVSEEYEASMVKLQGQNGQHGVTSRRLYAQQTA